MNDNIKTLIGWWKLRGQREMDPFIKFFFFYVCFDAWITAESGKDRDIEKIDWFINNNNCLKNKWKDIQSSVTKSWLANLKNLSPVADMRPNHRGKKVYLNDTENLEDVVKFIYQIRSNLFHGSKNPMNNRDANLVELSGMILEKWIVWAHHKC
ncbi:MAG: hypothetical protein KJ915_08730 [Candidatus Omnitrophica bacterium]|nr:hypothetical protein [Candidatus Omnitrophota bacterium]